MTPWSKSTSRATSQLGYIMPMTALLLIPMLLFAGFATDVGAWFLRGEKAQVAADAGAVAGVVWIPDATTMSSNALEAVRRNGYPNASLVTSFADAEAAPVTPSMPWVTVTLTPSETLEVSVHTVAETYFSSLVLDEVRITRTAEAQFVEPTPLGNPTSALGTGGDTEYPGTANNFYLQTRTDTRRNGDIIGPATGVGGTPNPLFTNLAATPELQGAYFYAIEIPPAAVALGYDIELRVSCHWQSNDGDLDWAVYAPDATENDHVDNVAAGAIASGSWGRGDNSFCLEDDGEYFERDGTHRQFVDTADWIKLADASTSGVYILRARTLSGSAAYSIRVTRPGFPDSSAHCTSLPLTNESGGIDPATTGCPIIKAIDWIGSAAREDFNASGTDPIEIFLTEVRPELAGNRLEVSLFDPADGIECVRILDPFGNPVPFTWRTVDNEVWGYSHSEYNTFTNGGGTGDLPDTASVPCGASGGTALTDPRLPGDQTGGVGQIFQDRTVRFFLDIGTPACNGADCWYRVQYEKGATDTSRFLNDWNSWAVRVAGDPVRLVR